MAGSCALARQGAGAFAPWCACWRLADGRYRAPRVRDNCRGSAEEQQLRSTVCAARGRRQRPPAADLCQWLPPHAARRGTEGPPGCWQEGHCSSSTVAGPWASALKRRIQREKETAAVVQLGKLGERRRKQHFFLLSATRAAVTLPPQQEPKKKEKRKTKQKNSNQGVLLQHVENVTAPRATLLLAAEDSPPTVFFLRRCQPTGAPSYRAFSTGFRAEGLGPGA